MTKKEIIQLVRQHINDEQATAFTDGGNLEEPSGTNELIAYLDRAVDAYSQRQADARDARLLKRMTLSSGAALPEDFLKFAGCVPVDVTGGVASFYGEMATLPVKYYARLPYVSAYGDNATLPYQREQALTIAALAAIYALNKHEANVSQDLMLVGMGGAVNAGAER